VARWLFGGLAILKQWIAKPNLFEALWVAFWACSLPYAIYIFLRMLVGTDRVLASHDRLRIRHAIVNWGRDKEYSAPEIRDLRFQPGHGRRYSQIVFDYGAKTIGFGHQLDEAEANELISLIAQRCHLPASSRESAPRFWQGV
jgi:hypothetical protein